MPCGRCRTAGLTFTYRASGGKPPSSRSVEPWGVVSWRGRWYLVGRDRDRDAERVFRLSRIVGDVARTGERGSVVPPPGLDLRGMVARMASDEPRRPRASRCAPVPAGSRAATGASDPDPEGWTIVDVGFSDPSGSPTA